ncbi:MAG: hypothetical protein E7515_03200 [Ruminococcaceae bacterium]|nr:hypothetical protein [Oscillospiraceae bacterium]
MMGSEKMSEISKRCEYCFYGKTAADGETVLCPKKGPVSLDYCCRKYKYDILKREPKRKAPVESIDPEDYKL